MTEKLRRDGDPSGHPQAKFDRAKGAWYHLNSLGERTYHGIPAGKKWSSDGKRLIDAGESDPETPMPAP